MTLGNMRELGVKRLIASKNSRTRAELSITAMLLALLCLFSPAPARAGDNPLLGTWRLKSFVREVAGTGDWVELPDVSAAFS
jgi:hypothetical protein